MSERWVAIAASLLLAAIIFSVNVRGYDLWPPDEPRYALVAREMLDSGDYFLPRVNNEPYKEKPPLLFWSIAACSRLTHGVTPLSARMPSIIAALVTLMFTALLARQLFSRRVALWSVLILMTAQRFWWNARFGQIDMLLTALLTAGLYCYLRWEKKGGLFRLVLFYLLMAGGLYAKGPGVLVFPVLFVLARSWRNPAWKKHWTGLVAGGAFCVVLYGLWAVPAHLAFAREMDSVGSAVLGGNLIRQTLGRFFLGVSHANWPWYYLTTLPVDWLPWTLFFPWLFRWVWKKRQDTADVSFLLSWIVPAFIFFSIAIGKRAVYLLPLFPALAILFAATILDFMDNPSPLWRRRLGWIYGVMFLLLTLAPVALLFTAYKDSWTLGMVALMVATAACAFMMIPFSRSNGLPWLHGQIYASFLLIYLFTAILIFPVIDAHKSARPFCAPVAEMADKGVDFDLFTVGFAREEYVFYSRHFVRELHTEAIPYNADWDIAPMEWLKLQKKLSRSFVKAVMTVSIADIARIHPEELSALREVLQGALDKAGCSPALAQEFQEGLEKENALLFDAFDSDHPTFLYVQEHDWRWIYAVHADVRNALLLSRANVGSRHVLLFANPAGAQLFHAFSKKRASLRSTLLSQLLESAG